MDEDKANELGADPIRDQLNSIQRIESLDDVVTEFGKLGRQSVGSPIGTFISIDRKDATRYVTILVQSGTTLPDRDYYLNKDEPQYEAARKALREYVNKLFELAGIEANDPGAQVLEIESKLAEAQWPRVEMRDAERTYNSFTVDGLADLAKHISWRDYFHEQSLDEIKEVNVMTPSFFTALDQILEDTPVDAWKIYLQYQILDNYAPFLSDDFVEAHFELHSKQLGGVTEQEPRWKRGVSLLGGVLGEAVGELYVQKHFKPEAKERMVKLVDNLLKAFDSSIDELSWMTAETKVRAKEKLSKIDKKIGYPDVWRDYSKLTVQPGDLIGNLERAAEFEHMRQVDRLGKPIDRTEWGMTPQTVNAYYNPTKNEIVFPAAILQPPFFGLDAPDALNYGGIGAVIGHEISHAFDDQGSRYDGDGNLNNWWTDDDRKAFEDLTSRLVAQYEKYEPLDGKFINGKLTLGENIADLSGLAIAYKAYKASRDPNQSEESVAGWSGDQLFFIGWSRVWQRKYRDAEMIKRLSVDPHSPSQYRANGPVTNIDAFYQAFDVSDGDRLYKPVEDRIRIW
jgi:predicted metalloendopeptidase